MILTGSMRPTFYRKGSQRLGADVDTDIPDRIRDGYGLNRRLIDRAIEDGMDTIITCDNGIAAREEIAYGKEQGLDDRRDGSSRSTVYRRWRRKTVSASSGGCGGRSAAGRTVRYPFKGLCGAAVAYKLMEALYRSDGRGCGGCG